MSTTHIKNKLISSPHKVPLSNPCWNIDYHHSLHKISNCQEGVKVAGFFFGGKFTDIDDFWGEKGRGVGSIGPRALYMYSTSNEHWSGFSAKCC